MNISFFTNNNDNLVETLKLCDFNGRTINIFSFFVKLNISLVFVYSALHHVKKDSIVQCM